MCTPQIRSATAPARSKRVSVAPILHAPVSKSIRVDHTPKNLEGSRREGRAALSVDGQGQGLEVSGLGQRRMDRVIGIGTGDPQDAAGAAGLGGGAAAPPRGPRPAGLD